MKRRLLTVAALFALIPLPLLANEPGSCLELGAKERTSYVITTGDGHTMCGDIGDVVYADESRPKGEEVVWFRIDDATWVIRDPAVNAEARRLFVQANEIGRKQGEIGAKQGRIGAEQGKIGAEQARIATKQATAALRNEPAGDSSDRMRELGERMEALGREQGKYGEQMAALGEAMQRELAVAQRGLSQLLDRAMKDGTAVRVRRL
jgi:hypothetical protein